MPFRHRGPARNNSVVHVAIFAGYGIPDGRYATPQKASTRRTFLNDGARRAANRGPLSLVISTGGSLANLPTEAEFIERQLIWEFNVHATERDWPSEPDYRQAINCRNAYGHAADSICVLKAWIAGNDTIDDSTLIEVYYFCRYEWLWFGEESFLQECRRQLTREERRVIRVHCVAVYWPGGYQPVSAVFNTYRTLRAMASEKYREGLRTAEPNHLPTVQRLLNQLPFQLGDRLRRWT